MTLIRNLLLPIKGSLFSILLKRTMPFAVLALTIAGFIILERAETARQGKIQDELSQQTKLDLQILADRLDNIVDQVGNLAESSLVVNGLIDHEGRDFYMPPFFRSLKLASPAEVEVSLTDYKGRILYQNKTQDGEMEDGQSWLSHVIDDGHPYFKISDLQLFVAYPVKYSGFTEGALIARVSSKEFPELFRLPLTTAELMVYQPDETVLTASDAFLSHLGQGTATAQRSGMVYKKQYGSRPVQYLDDNRHIS